jgi:hypothetical protein
MVAPRRDRRRLRPSDWPIPIVACLGLPTAFVLWLIGTPLEDTYESIYHSLPLHPSDYYGSGGSASGFDPVSCVNLVERSQRNSTDKNNNRLFLRYTKDHPQFWISLHEKNFDQVRWKTFHVGRYYEQTQVRLYGAALA